MRIPLKPKLVDLQGRAFVGDLAEGIHVPHLRVWPQKMIEGGLAALGGAAALTAAHATTAWANRRRKKIEKDTGIKLPKVPEIKK